MKFAMISAICNENEDRIQGEADILSQQQRIQRFQIRLFPFVGCLSAKAGQTRLD